MRVVSPVTSQPKGEHHSATGDHGQVYQDEDDQHHLGHLLFGAEAAGRLSRSLASIWRDD